jgi:hypothetical protein
MNGGVRFRNQYRKPVIYDECRYEGDIPQGWGNLTAREMTQRFWLGTLSGCYVGHGETYKHPEDLLWWAKGGVLRGESPKRIQWLKDLMASHRRSTNSSPWAMTRAGSCSPSRASSICFYCLDMRSHPVQLEGQRPYKLDLIDPWAMTVTPIGTATAGEFALAAPKPDMVYRFTPYQPGEKLRPEAKITASVTEGTPPLTVKFTSIGRRADPLGFRRRHNQRPNAIPPMSSSNPASMPSR